jgi:hypothetical protein
MKIIEKLWDNMIKSDWTYLIDEEEHLNTSEEDE